MTPARKRKIVVFILLGCMMLSSSLSRINSTHVNSDDVSAIILVTDSFGWNYFDAVSCFEEIGVDVTTI